MLGWVFSVFRDYGKDSLMSSDNLAISVNNVSKIYQIYKQPQDRLKQAIVSKAQKLVGLEKTSYYRDFWALKNVSFKLKKGETVGIIGRNGSGKSTLLQIVCGILMPNEGFCEVNGSLAALLELGSGFNPEFTGLENVEVYGQLLGLSQEKIRKLLPEILDFADIGEFIHQPVKTYSSGMMIRLAFAVSISREPDILVVDEALAVGDAAFSRKCFARIESLRERGTTVLFVSHASSTVVEICNRAIVLDRGELIYDGVPKEAVALYTKLLFSSASKREEVCDEIKSTWISGINSNQISNQDLNKELISDKEEIKKLSQMKAFYVEGLVSESLVEYEKLGLVIEDPYIRTLDSKPVNALIEGETYQYCYRVRFIKKCWNLTFGMLIKTTSGYELGGAAHPAYNKYIDFADAEDTLIVTFDFKCLLAPGIYFLNAGVQGSQTEFADRQYLHRILDAVMFKVIPQDNYKRTGIINFEIVSSVKDISLES